MIPDELYEESMDLGNMGISAASLIDSYPRLACLFDNIPPNKLRELQLCHDNAAVHLTDGYPSYVMVGKDSFLPEFQRRLRKFCKKHNLKYPSPAPEPE